MGEILHNIEPCSRARPAPTGKLDTLGGAGHARDVNPELLHLHGGRTRARNLRLQDKEISPFGRNDRSKLKIYSIDIQYINK